MIQYLPWALIVVGIFLLWVMRVWSRGVSENDSSPVATKRMEAPAPSPPKWRESRDVDREKLLRQAQEVQAHSQDERVSRPRPPSSTPPRKPTNWVATVITLMVLGSALYIILTPGLYPDTQQK